MFEKLPNTKNNPGSWPQVVIQDGFVRRTKNTLECKTCHTELGVGLDSNIVSSMSKFMAEHKCDTLSVLHDESLQRLEKANFRNGYIKAILDVYNEIRFGTNLEYLEDWLLKKAEEKGKEKI